MTFHERAQRLRPWLRIGAVVSVLTLVGGTPAAPRALWADGTPEAQQVIDRFLEVIGGREALDSIRMVHARGRVEAFGLKGSIETWTARPDRRASTMSIGPIQVSQGYDGETAWRTDPNGKVLILDGKDRESALGASWFDNRRWLEPDHAGGSIRHSPDEQYERFDVLEMVAPNGDKRLVWFEKETGLLTQTLTTNDQQKVYTNLFDYKRYGGLLFATRAFTTVAGMPKNDVQVFFDTLLVNEDTASAPFSPPGEEVALARFLEGLNRATFPFDYDSRHIWLEVSVNGNRPVDFVFDTGASITVIDSAYAAEIGLETQGELQGQGAGALGSASLATVELLRLRGIGRSGVEAVNHPVAVLSINDHLEPYVWRRCAGVLGFNFINQFVCEIDYDHRRLMLKEPATFQYEGKGEAIPMTLAGTAPTVHMTINEEYEGDFRVDVGSSATVDLHSPFVAQNDLMKKAKKSVEIQSGGFGGGFKSTITRMEHIALGPFSWEDPIVSLSQAEQGALASKDYAGNIGNRVLERFKCTFDYDRRVLYLEPGKRYAAPDVFSKAGLQLGRFEDGVKAVQVIDGTPAAKAGIRTGDGVHAIDGKPAGEYTRAELDALLEEGAEGRKVVFEIERNGKAKKVTVRLKEIL